MTELHDPVSGSSEPDRYWTFTNSAEATPAILSPLCWSVWADPEEHTFLASMHALGVLPKRAVVLSPDPNDRAAAAIYGRQAFNVDVMRQMIGQLPGADVDGFERDLLGIVRSDAPKTQPALRRLPFIAARAPGIMIRSAAEVDSNFQSTLQWWRTEVLAVHNGTRPARHRAIDDLDDAASRFARSFYLHSFARYQLTAIQGGVLRIAEKSGLSELGTEALAAQGGVLETSLADDTWRLAHNELTLEAFIGLHGFHGPNEGNVYTTSWREEPRRVEALAAAHKGRPADARPSRRAAAASVAARRAAAELIGASSRRDQVVLRLLLRAARRVIPQLETGKAGYVIPLDGARAAARRFGAEQVDAGRFDDPDDAFFLTIPELHEVDEGGLRQARELIAYRRARRKEYAAMDLPVNFKGLPTPIPAGEADSAEDRRSLTVTGAASGGGVAEGRARVVADPDVDVDLDEGDILVCRFTDPSWAPLFTLAEALVIDIGGAASHGAVVAREMGIPYVIGTQCGTSVIRDGDLVRVDGPANCVQILEAASDNPAGANLPA